MMTSMRACCLFITAFLVFFLPRGKAQAAGEELSLIEAFKQGTFRGQLKSYYFAQAFDGEGLNDSSIWVNGGNLSYTTAKFHGFDTGATFQASFVGHKDDEDGKTRGSMDADGAVLSEAYLGYALANTEFKGGRQYLSSPMVAGSGSRMIKESFEAYMLSNRDIPNTTITAGLVTRYQTRTDRTFYADNRFVDFEQNGDGRPGDFYDIGDGGMLVVYAGNSPIDNLKLQAQYTNVFDVVAGFYADAKYVFPLRFKPYFAGQIYYTDYEETAKDGNELFGFKAGAHFSDFEVFAGFTSSGGDAGDARVFRGVGQGAYAVFTSATKSSGAPAYEAGTDSFQAGIAYSPENLSTKFRYTNFDNPAAGRDLDEYTLNVLYKFHGWANGFSVSVDFSVLDYEDDQKDATDLRTRLVYAF